MYGNLYITGSLLDRLKMESWYDKEEDVLNIQLEEGEYWKSIELKDMIIDISKEGKILGIEIIKASKVFSGNAQKVIETARAASTV